MANASRTIRVRFDGSAKGLIAAAAQAGIAVEGFEKQVKRSSVATSASSIGGGLIDALGSLPSVLKGAAIVAAAGIGTVMAPALASALISGVLLIVGGGALAAGIVGAAKSPKVVRAWKGFALQASRTFDRFSQPFVAPLVRAAGTFTKALKRAEPIIRQIGATIAPVIDRLAPALALMVERALPGILAATQAAVPLFGVLADHLPGLGASLALFFQILAQASPLAQVFFGNFLSWVENVLPKLAGVLVWLQDLGPKIDAFKDKFAPLTDALKTVGDFIVSGFKEAREMLHRWLDANNDKIKRFIEQVSGFIKDTGPTFQFVIIGIALSLQASANAVLALVDALDRLKRWYNSNKGWLMALMGVAPWFSNQESGIPNIGQRAAGGPVEAGRSYLVGEKGPEILRMGGRGGYIVPNDEIAQASSASAAGSGPLIVENHIEIGGEVVRVVRTEIRENNRNLKRGVLAGAGAR